MNLSLQMMLESQQRINIKKFITLNPFLKKFKFDTSFVQDVKGFDLLPAIVASNVTHLAYAQHDNKSLFSSLSKSLFSRFPKLESLTLVIKAEGLVNLPFTSDKLKMLNIHVTDEKKSLPMIGDFIKRNPNLTQHHTNHLRADLRDPDDNFLQPRVLQDLRPSLELHRD